MAFGDKLGSATGIASGNSVVAASTALTVSAGDLVVAVYNNSGNENSPATCAFSDNLGNTWTNLTSGANAAAPDTFAAYTIVTTAGSMTVTGTGSVSSTTKPSILAAVQYAGPFATTPLDKNPATTSGNSSGVLSAPATGVLAQASELIVSFASQVLGTAPTAQSPFTLDSSVVTGSTNAIAIEHEVVSSTASVTPTWSISKSNYTFGTAAFKASGSGVTGTLSVQESGSDTAAASGTVLVSGSLAAQGTGSDTASASGTVAVSGAMSAQGSGSDTSAATGTVLVSGAMAAAESGSDTPAFSGTVTLPSGSLAARETGADQAAGSGTVAVAGVLAARESGADTAAASGTVAVSGSMAAVGAGSDSAVISGFTSTPGILAAVESGADTAHFYAHLPPRVYLIAPRRRISSRHYQ